MRPHAARRHEQSELLISSIELLNSIIDLLTNTAINNFDLEKY